MLQGELHNRLIKATVDKETIAVTVKGVADVAITGQPIAVTISEQPINTNIIGPIDEFTGSINTIDYAHHEAHQGSHFFYSSHHDLLKNGVDEHLIITPDTTKWAHMLYNFASTAGQVHVELSEDATYSDVGVLDASFNRNRNFPDNNTTFVYDDPTITTQGTVIYSTKLGADDKKVSIGGGARGSKEIILKQNTVYLLRITELNVESTIINIDLDWYEHTNK